MTRFLQRFALVFALLGAGTVAAFADASPAEQYEQKLKTYDPAAVEAAKAYAKTFDIMAVYEKSAPMMAKAMAGQLKTKNPALTDDQIKVFTDTFQHAALVDNADVMNHAIVLILLDVMTKDELVALSQFYSSPIGAGILRKFPVLSDRIGNVRKLMKTDIVPRALDAAKAKLKESGVIVNM